MPIETKRKERERENTNERLLWKVDKERKKKHKAEDKVK